MLRKKTSEKDPSDWLAFAEERLMAADILWKMEGLTATGIESLQEAAERFLKGYLIAKGWELVKTHDLTRLIREAGKLDHGFKSFERFGADLTEDFFAQHYPGSDTTDLGDDYDNLRKQMSELLQLIRSNLPEYFPK